MEGKFEQELRTQTERSSISKFFERKLKQNFNEAIIFGNKNIFTVYTSPLHSTNNLQTQLNTQPTKTTE